MTADYGFLAAAASHGVTLDKEAFERFSLYADLLAAKNAVMNLTSVDDPEGICLRHFADSLALFSHLPKAPCAALDVGSGAGFPGLPLKIVRPDLRLVLLDATGKKVDFLREVVAGSRSRKRRVRMRARRGGRSRPPSRVL